MTPMAKDDPNFPTTQALQARLAVGTADQVYVRCRLCTCGLSADQDADHQHGFCGSCKDRPEARRLKLVAANSAVAVKPVPRSFTVADKSLIAKVGGFMPAEQLLGILNDRLKGDLGEKAIFYTLDQLYVELGNASAAAPAGGHDWASLRKLMSQARRSGLLDSITDQMIEDFALVFSLHAKQVLALKDAIKGGRE